MFTSIQKISKGQRGNLLPILGIVVIVLIGGVVYFAINRPPQSSLQNQPQAISLPTTALSENSNFSTNEHDEAKKVANNSQTVQSQLTKFQFEAPSGYSIKLSNDLYDGKLEFITVSNGQNSMSVTIAETSSCNPTEDHTNTPPNIYPGEKSKKVMIANKFVLYMDPSTGSDPRAPGPGFFTFDGRTKLEDNSCITVQQKIYDRSIAKEFDNVLEKARY